VKTVQSQTQNLTCSCNFEHHPLPSLCKFSTAFPLPPALPISSYFPAFHFLATCCFPILSCMILLVATSSFYFNSPIFLLSYLHNAFMPPHLAIMGWSGGWVESIWSPDTTAACNAQNITARWFWAKLIIGYDWLFHST